MDATPDTFEPQCGTAFTVALDGGDSLDLELAEVDRAPRREGAPRAEPFALIFEGPPDPVLTQRIHRLSHPRLGDLEIFLVPIQPVAGRQRYEAVFN